MALPAGLRRLGWDDLPRERWRNGMGWTRAVALDAGGDAAGEAVRWRVSLAEISQAAPFSRFEGMDRTAVLVHGGPLRLCGPDREWALNTPGDLARFAGEAPLDNTAPLSEARIWNVMTRRGQARAEVQVHDAAQGALPLVVARGARDAGDAGDAGDQGAHTLVWVLAGRCALRDAAGRTLCTLEAAEGLHQSPSGGAVAALSLHPLSPETRLVCTRLV
jgi:environmental stress-induced protein Ves